MRACLAAIVVLVLTATCPGAGGPTDRLASWRDTATKRAILTFVERVTREGGPEYVKPDERLAVFDNDGTLWCEKPMYVQAEFILDRIKALAPQHPDWKTKQPYKAILENDTATLANLGEQGLVDLVTTTHSGMSTEEFAKIVRDWIRTAKHPRFDRPYTQCVYQPMLELIAYLKLHQFKVYIVSGGGVDFMRAWTQEIYGIPPENVIGSTVKLRYEVVGNRPRLFRLPTVDFVDDHAGKPIGIERHIGRRPIAAFGNSDGDFEMLQYVTAGPGARLGAIVHHTDSEREYAYDRDSKVGRLDRALTEAGERGWLLIDMKRDWSVIFADTPAKTMPQPDR